MASSGERTESDPATYRAADPWSGLCLRLGPLVRRRVAHAQDAEDIVSEAVLRAFVRFGAAPQPMDLFRWAINTARGLAVDRARTRARCRWAEAIDPDSLPIGDAAVPSVDLRDHLNEASATLSAADRQVLSMLLAGADSKAVATAQGVSNRAIQKTRDRIWLACTSVRNVSREVPNRASKTVLW